MDSVYLMFNPWLPFRFKIGISNDVSRRAKENGAIRLFDFRLPAARYIESGLHGFYRPLHWLASKRHSGHTEYFVCLNPMAACALFLLYPDLMPEVYAIAFFLPVPIDAAAILYGIAAVVYAGFAFALLSIVYALITFL